MRPVQGRIYGGFSIAFSILWRWLDIAFRDGFLSQRQKVPMSFYPVIRPPLGPLALGKWISPYPGRRWATNLSKWFISHLFLHMSDEYYINNLLLSSNWTMEALHYNITLLISCCFTIHYLISLLLWRNKTGFMLDYKIFVNECVFHFLEANKLRFKLLINMCQ